LEIGHLRARTVTSADFRDFDHIIALDKQNLADLEAMKPKNASAEMSLLLDHIEGREGDDVADPFYGDDAAFDQTWAEVISAAKGICERLKGRN
jgi:protein-tyrosine phosphatase